MSLPLIVVCGFCGKCLRMDTEHRLKPGLHLARIEVTKTMCPRCKKKYDEDMTSNDPPRKDNSTGKK
jgi:hypothetical protein